MWSWVCCTAVGLSFGAASARDGHFMPPALLDSQLATLELPAPNEAHVIANIDNPPDHIIQTLVAATQELQP